MVHPKNSEVQDTEVIIALPQNRQYDHVKKGDVLEIGWDEKSGICFAEDAS
jgi:spermidine/putrescine transport system ATP-binding protein